MGAILFHSANLCRGSVDVNSFRDSLIGQTCISVQLAAEGGHCWQFRFDRGAVITIECTWRIIQSDRIALGGEDHKQVFGLPAPVDGEKIAAELVGGSRVTNVTIDEKTADLAISFANSALLQALNDS